jgi:excisionase family DNA binding protein
MNDRLLTARHVADETGLSYDAVRRAIAAGELKATRLRGRLLVRREWLDEWVESSVVSPATSAIDLAHRRPVAGRNPSARDTTPGSLARLDAIEHGDR